MAPIGEVKIRNVILAGGPAGRMNAISNPQLNKYPLNKVVCPVGNRRAIDFSLQSLYDIGERRFTVYVFHLAESVKRITDQSITAFPDKIEMDYFEASKSSQPGSSFKLLDTAEATAKICREYSWEQESNSLLVVLSADIVHNVNLSMLIEAHCKNRRDRNAVATIAVNSVPWDEVRHFGGVSLEGMPQRADFKSDKDFEDAVGAWLIHNQSASAKILEFREKEAGVIAPSNLINSSIYIFNADFFRVLYPMLTKKESEESLFPDVYQGGPTVFSDWGKHVFKWLTEDQKTKEICPIFGYILPASSYWKDIGCGEDLRQANLDVLREKIKTGLDDKRFWRKEPWGWKGIDVLIDSTAQLDVSRPSIIGNNVSIGPGVKISHSVIGANTHVQEGAEIEETVIFPGHYLQEKPNLIGAHSKLVRCLVTGGIVEPNAEVIAKMLYYSYAGDAVDNLFRQTEI